MQERERETARERERERERENTLRNKEIRRTNRVCKRRIRMSTKAHKRQTYTHWQTNRHINTVAIFHSTSLADTSKLMFILRLIKKPSIVYRLQSLNYAWCSIDCYQDKLKSSVSIEQTVSYIVSFSLNKSSLSS